jgi:hypothetical protein
MQQPYGIQGYGPVNEVTYFADQGIQVTSTRFVVFGQMYPVNGITSVAPFTISAKRGWLIFWACFWALGVLGGLGTLFSRGEPGGFLFCGFITGLIVWRIIVRKDIHGIMIATAGGQIRALSTPNLPLVHAVMSALHQAVAARG